MGLIPIFSELFFLHTCEKLEYVFTFATTIGKRGHLIK
ncbi:hypothetical protein DFQ04_3171 [Algoriphagus boseongensis]|uniref:Uncharacterized protein n=1 Tax=Algoriphagus boseongensis TaxID=1442587 RepID=A0A4R6T3I7_9BACT|nr:hypothetical protein DFQ04_3171 [Algoriphagus boseongensis]